MPREYRSTLDPEQLYAYERRKEAKAQGGKWCRGCDTIFPLNDKFFYRNHKACQSHPYMSVCKDCANLGSTGYKRRRMSDEKRDLLQRKEDARAQGKKLCTRCLQPKEPSAFQRMKQYDPRFPLKYLYSHCKECHNKDMREAKARKKRSQHNAA